MPESLPLADSAVQQPVRPATPTQYADKTDAITSERHKSNSEGELTSASDDSNDDTFEP